MTGKIRQKTENKDRRLNIVITVVSIVIAAMVLVLLFLFLNPASRADRMEYGELDEICQTIDYDAYRSDPASYKGTYVKLRVQIYQKVNDRLFNVYTAAEGETDADSWMGGHYLLNDERRQREPQIEEGQIITVYGRCAGLQKMTAAKDDGADGLPAVDVLRIDFAGNEPTADEENEGQQDF